MFIKLLHIYYNFITHFRQYYGGKQMDVSGLELAKTDKCKLYIHIPESCRRSYEKLFDSKQ